MKLFQKQGMRESFAPPVDLEPHPNYLQKWIAEIVLGTIKFPEMAWRKTKGGSANGRSVWPESVLYLAANNFILIPESIHGTIEKQSLYLNLGRAIDDRAHRP